MEPKPFGTPMDLLGTAALTTSLVMGFFPSLQSMSMSFMGAALMAGAFSQVQTNWNTRYCYLPTVAAALATCVAGYGVHATIPITKDIVALAAMVSVALQCVVAMKEMGEPEPCQVLDAEFVPCP